MSFINSTGLMQHFNEFIIEVQTLDIRVTEMYYYNDGKIVEYTPEQVSNAPYRKANFLDLRHYDQPESDYEAKLKRLEQLALNEILNLSPEQIKLQIKRLEQIIERYKKFWKLYLEQHKAFREKKFDTTDLEIKILPFFTVPKYKLKYKICNISQQFMFDLHDAAMFKQAYLKSFVCRIKEVMKFSGSESPQRNKLKINKLKLKQIALIYVYESKQITRENASGIVAEYGYTSGEKLFQNYTYFCSLTNRSGRPTFCTPKKLKNKIELFKSVIEHLTNKAQQRAIDEIKILNTLYENEYQ